MSGEQSTWTVETILKWSTDFLRAKGSPSSRLDAELLLAKSLQCDRIKLYTQLDRPLNAEERQNYRELLQRRARAEPIAYVLGNRSFWRHNFSVTPDVLIPRPETELILEIYTKLRQAQAVDAGPVLDVGVGSGCLAISLAFDFPGTSVFGWEKSSPALAIADQNAQNILGEKSSECHFEQRDALMASAWEKQTLCNDGFATVISNPPYISKLDVGLMDQGVVAFEPESALFAEQGGLAFYEAFAHFAPRVLKKDGWLIVEVGAGAAESVKEILQRANWREIRSAFDLGGIERVIYAMRPCDVE